MKSTVYILSLFFIAMSLGVSAQTSEEYKFNSAGDVKPEFKDEFKFTVPSDGGKKAEEYVQEAEVQADRLYIAPIGYPKKTFFATVNPTFNGFKNTFSGSRTYNYGGITGQAASVGWRYASSLEEDFTTRLDIMSISVKEANDSVNNLRVAASTAMLWNAAFEANFCKVKETAFHRLCPGLEIALDNFPTLQYPQTSNTTIELKAVRDMTVGANLRYERPVFGASRFEGRVGANFGFGAGSTGDLTTKSNQKFTAVAAFTVPAKKFDWLASVGLEYRAAKLESNIDRWDIQNLSYAGRLGLKYEWGGM
jgi:hypothetical protein